MVRSYRPRARRSAVRMSLVWLLLSPPASKMTTARPCRVKYTRYWRMSANSILQRALTNRWLHEHGVPDMRTQWIVLHYGPNARI